MTRFLLFYIVLLLSSCNTGVILIERSERLPNESVRLKTSKVLLLEPEARKIDIVNNIRQDYSGSEALQQQFEKYMRQSAGKNNINLEIQSVAALSGNDLRKYQQLLALKNHVLQANPGQGQSPDQGRTMSSEGLSERLMASSPQLLPEYSSLISVTGTPYIAFSGWTSIDSRNITDEGRTRTSESFSVSKGQNNIFFFIVINLETAEVMYREIKHATGPAENQVLLTSLYDTFFLFRKHIGKS